VQGIVADRAAGNTLAAIAARLNEAGVKTAQGGKRWYASTIQAVIDSASHDAHRQLETVDVSHGFKSQGPLSVPGPFGGSWPPPGQPEAGSLLGREDALRDLSASLRTTRLLTLTGPPGIGKSRLARELAAQHTRGDASLSCWVDLASVTDPALVPMAVARALMLWEEQGRGLSETVVAHLAVRRLLLVLDNCEHLPGAVTELMDAIYAGCPAVTVLATSQAPLGYREEITWPVPALGVPGPGDHDPESLSRYGSVRLFCQRAAQARFSFRLTQDVASSVAEICRSLDGIPLGIELAAARVAVLSPQQIAGRLDGRFSLLTGGGDAAPSRHRTLLSALEWSYGLLPAAERELLRTLSVFTGEFTLEAVEALCGDGSAGPDGVLDQLAALVTKSLLVADTSGDDARYRLLETIRLFAAEQLAAMGETVASRARHSRWCLSLAERAEPELTGQDQVAWLKRLDECHDDLRSALSRSGDEAGADVTLRIAGALTIFWRMRGHFREGRETLTRVLATAVGRPPTVRAKGLWGLGFMALMTGDGGAAIRALEESLSLARKDGDRVREARCLMLLGNQAVLTDRRHALPLLQQSAEVARQIGDTWCQAHAHALVARLHIDSADVERAQTELADCLSVARLARDDQGLRIGLILLGELHARQGDFVRGKAAVVEALHVSRRLGEPYAISQALALLGDIATSQGHWEEAREIYATDPAQSLDSGSIDSTLGVLCRMGRLAREQGDNDAARELYGRAIALGRETGWVWEPAFVGLGEVAASQGMWHEARELFDEALRLAEGRQDPWQTATATTCLARVARHEGHPARAVRLYGRALDICRRTGAVPQVAPILEDMAALGIELGLPERAVRLSGAADAIRRQLTSSSRRPNAPIQEAELRRVRRVLGNERVEAAWAQGARLDVSEAISYALRGWGRRDRGSSGWSSLTPAERNVVDLVAQGLTNAETGTALFISPRTVETHLRRIFSKLNLKSRGEVRREAGRRSRLAVERRPPKMREGDPEPRGLSRSMPSPSATGPSTPGRRAERGSTTPRVEG